MKIIYYLSVTLLLLASCEMKKDLVGGGTNSEGEVINPATMGAVDLNLKLYPEINTEETLSKANFASTVDIEDFVVQIIDSLGKVAHHFETYREYKLADLLLVEGLYTFRSSWGILRDAAFDAPYFLSDTIVRVQAGKVTSITADCYMQNAKVNVNYTPDFLKVFKDDYAAVITNAVGAITLNKEEVRVAYFSTENNIRMEIQATTHKGIDIISKHEFVDIQPNMLYDIKLGIDVTVESVIDNLVKPGITVDLTMHNRDTIINIAPPELPEPPVNPEDDNITIKGTGITSAVEMTEAEATAGSVPVKVTITAKAGLKVIYVKVIAPALEEVLGDENPFELISPSDAMKGILDAVGLLRPTAGDTQYALDITGFMKLLGGAGTYQFKVDVIDNAENTATATLTILIK